MQESLITTNRRFLQHRMREYKALKAEIAALQVGVANNVNVNGH
jgi:hypothetical protein